MKKYREIFLILIIMIGIVVIPISHADSGWDGSYDSGFSDFGSSSSSWDSGSSSWGSSSSSWDYDSGNHDYTNNHYHYNYLKGPYNNSNNQLLGIILVVGFISILGIFIIIKVIKRTSSSLMDLSYKSVLNNNLEIIAVPYDIEKIKKILPDFSKESFQNLTYEIYKKIQIAWSNFDYETLRKYTTDELYNLYRSQLVALNVKKQKNVMKDFELYDFEIVGMEYNIDSISLKLQMIIECYDYVVDVNNSVVRGSDDYKFIYHYEMTFICGLAKKDNKCPNCNAPLDNQNSNVCPYCDSVVIGNNYDWVLAKKSMIRQGRK